MTTFALDLAAQDEVFFEERRAADELTTFRTELLIQLLNNTILEGALNIHRELLGRELSEDQLRSISETHPRFVFAHKSASSELRGEIILDDGMRARLLTSPFLNRGKYCKACVLDNTSGRMR